MPEKNMGSPGVGDAGGCGLVAVGVGNKSQIPCKNSKYSQQPIIQLTFLLPDDTSYFFLSWS